MFQKGLNCTRQKPPIIQKVAKDRLCSLQLRRKRREEFPLQFLGSLKPIRCG